MSCYKSASVVERSGIAGFILIVEIEAFAGIVPPTLGVGYSPFDPKNVFPVIIHHSVPAGTTRVHLELTQKLTKENEFDFVEIFCGDAKSGKRIPVVKE